MIYLRNPSLSSRFIYCLLKLLENLITDILLSYHKRLDKLDLGENFLSSIPRNMFNSSLSVNDLNLDYNYIEKLHEDAFKSISPRRIYLGMNKIKYIHENAFGGLEQTLGMFVNNQIMIFKVYHF